MRASSATVFALGLALCTPAARAENPFDGSLGFCRTVSTPMPDPTAPDFYTALPTRDGIISGAGWSGHVRAWFRFMRNRENGGVRQYLDHDKQLSGTTDAYRVVVVEKGGKLLKETERATFEKSVQDLDRRTNSRVSDLLNEYVNESGEAARAYRRLVEQAVPEAEASRQDLVAVLAEYDAFLTALQYDAVAREKKELLEEAAEVSGMVSGLIGSLASAAGVVPLDAISIMKGLKGDPFASIVKMAFGPDPATLGRLDARLRMLDEKLRGHRERGFTARIEATRFRVQKARSASEVAAEEVLVHKMKTWQAVQELAGLEREGQRLQFFRPLRDYYKAVASAGASLNEAVNRYHRWLNGTWLSEGQLLAAHIDVDAEFVRRQGTDPTGQWMNLAAEPEAWLKRDYLPWHRDEVDRVATCLAGFKQLRHLHLVNEAMKLAIVATGGIPVGDLGTYLF